MLDVVVFGAGGHAGAVIDTLEKTGRYHIVGLLDSFKPPKSIVYGYEVLGDHQILKSGSHRIQHGIVAIGDNWTRARIVQEIRALVPDFRFVTAIHPGASVARGVSIGEGTVVMAGAIINSNAQIGEHCILYSNSSVDHDSSVGHYVTLAPNSATGGHVRIGDYSVLSIGANVIHSAAIGEHAVIGAGATVLSDISGYTVAYGTPARAVKSRAAGEPYLIRKKTD